MKFCVLASGSKGNMTYIESKNTKILIDAGISLRNAQSRTSTIDITEVEHILITHEHTDHTNFLCSLAKQINPKIYITRRSYSGLGSDVKEKLNGKTIYFIEAESKYILGDLTILTLSLSHDSKEVLGYIVDDGTKKIAYITDTGAFPIKYYHIMKDLDAIILEANHDVKMLQESDREARLKQRIISPKGHLSNNDCCLVLQKIISDTFKYIVLAHVSEECNCNEMIERDVISRLKPLCKAQFLIASQEKSTKLMEL